MLSIRNATIADIPMIRELNLQIWPQTYASILSKDQIAYMLEMMFAPEVLQRQMEEPGHRFILCYDNDQPVAFASFSPASEGAYKLHKIYVLPNQHGKGIGRYMINYISNELRKLHAPALYLNVNRYNPAKSFYEKLGFTVDHEEDIHIGNGYFMNDYILKLAL
jgi:diamine N-acetyltransferase